jgi:hypothetical protein
MKNIKKEAEAEVEVEVEKEKESVSIREAIAERLQGCGPTVKDKKFLSD